MRQSSDDRILYYRQLRQTISTVLLPELVSAQAIDAAALIDRILVQFTVEELAEVAVGPEFGDIGEEASDIVRRAAASADPGEREQACRLVEVERRFLEHVDELRCEELVTGLLGAAAAGVIDGCSVTPDQLTAYLRCRLPGSPGVVVGSVSILPGGRSKETMLVSVSGTDELPDQVIVRKDRPIGLLPTKAADEFEIMAAVHRFGGVPIARPLVADREDVGLGEGTLLVMECVAGRKAGEFFPDLAAPSDHRAEIGRQLAASLARLHSLPLDQLGATHLDPDPPPVTAASIVGMVEGISARIEGLTGPPCATVPLARQWLVDHVSDVVPARRQCLLQGDFGLHNTLVDGARVTALVDWEAATIGPPARELAAAWAAGTTLLTWPEFIHAYLEAGGPAEGTDPAAINYYRVLSALGVFMTSRMGGHLFRTGAKRDLLTAHSGLDSHFRCTRNLGRALADALSYEERN